MVLPFADRGMTRAAGGHASRPRHHRQRGSDGATSQAQRHAAQGHHRLPPRGFRQGGGHDDTDFILLGVASAGVEWAIDKLAAVLKKPVPVIMITKGMSPEPAGLGAFPDVVQAALEKKLGFKVPVAAIGGPCIAGELAVRRQTGTVIVSHDAALAQSFARDFETDYYHPRTSTDMMGVEVCAAFKNFLRHRRGLGPWQARKPCPRPRTRRTQQQCRRHPVSTRRCAR
jgi:hypothetical protein